MHKKLRKKWVIVSTTLLSLQTLIFPIGQVLAQTSEETQETAEQATLPEMDTYFPKDEIVSPRFFFAQSRLEGTVGEPLKVTMVSDQEVSEIQVTLPKEAQILTDQLPVGLSIQPGEQAQEWRISAVRPQQTFVLPVIFEETGSYKVTMEDKEVLLEINPAVEEETAIDQEEDHESKEETFESKEAIDSDEEPSVIDQFPNPSNEEEPADEEQEERFEGEIAEVNTFEEFRLAVANPTISQIDVRNNLTRSGTGAATAIGTLNRSLVINGNGFTINFGADNGSLNLGTLSDTAAVIRVQNATITKTGATSIFNASGTGLGWTLELEDITEGSANASRLALLPEGQVVFTGGTNQFVRTSITNVFLQAKHIEARGGAQVTISRGNSGIFFSAATVTQPKIVIKEQANISIITASGTGVAIDLRGPDAKIELSEAANLQVQTQGTTAAATNTANNAIAMTGSTPTLSVTGGSNIQVNTTSAKRGIALMGSTPSVVLEDSSLAISSATARALEVTGQNAALVTTNATLDLTTTTGQGIRMDGQESLVDFSESEVNVLGQTATRIYVQGSNGQIRSQNSKGTLTSTTGFGFYLTGGDNQVLLDETSEWTISGSGSSQSLGIVSENPQLYVMNNSSLTATSGQGTTVNILLQGINPEIKVENNAKLSLTTSGTTANPTDTSNLAVSLTGANPSVIVQNDSELTVNVTANAKRGLQLNGAEPNITFESSSMVINTITVDAIRFQGASAAFTLTDSEVNLLGATTGNRLHFLNGGSKLELDNSILNSDATTGRGFYMLGNNNTVRLTNASEVNMKSTTGNNIAMTGNNASLIVEKASQLNTTSGAVESIQLAGNNAILKVLDPKTKLLAQSNFTSDVDGQSTIRVGGLDPDVRSETYLIEVGREAILEAKANISSAMQVSANDGEFVVSDGGKLLLENGATNQTGSSSNANATLRFSRTGTAATTGGHSFVIDNGKMELNKTGGNASSLRMFGSNNEVSVQNSGVFSINNTGSGSGSDGGSGSSSQGIDFREGNNNRFLVADPGSRVDIQAVSGPAIDMTGTGSIHATNAGFFQASGRTSTAAGGIFNAGVLTVAFDDPLFMDFRNNRPGGGNLFNVSAGSTMTATNSDLAVWRNGVDLDGDPDLNFRNIGYSFSGTNFNTLASTTDPDQLNTGVFGTSGLTSYSRMSSNNGRWAIADELRVPTNADKKIHGRISIPVGLDDSRPAWDDEAIVTVEVIPPTGESREYTAKTVGDSDESPGISIYGEEARGGLFEINLDEPLEAGSIVQIKEVALTSGELTDGFSHQILTDPVEVFPILPPTPAQFTSSILAPNTAVIEGVTDNQDAEVTATHNGEKLDTSDVTVDQNGRFVLDLSGLTLEEEDEIQVFLRDAEGSASAAGVINPPETNNARGNINPATPMTFRDATFAPATILTVGASGPVAPVDPLNPETEVNPENKPNLPEEQGLLSIDFASTFNFGSQAISAQEKTYYAKPQRLLNEDGTVNEAEERPNYIQISDRRSENDRNGWQLAVTQNGQFETKAEEPLLGARLSFTNQALATAQGGILPELQQTNPLTLVPGVKRVLVMAQGDEGAGTWIYRFGDQATAGQSIALTVPQGANPKAEQYKTSLTWELSAVPGNE